MTRYLRTKIIPLDELTPFPGNARRGKVGVITESLRRNGQYRSLIVREVENGPMVVLAGNHTMQALIDHGPGKCEFGRASDPADRCALCGDGARSKATARCEIYQCDDAAARRINIVDNRSSDLATDDEEAMAELLTALEGDYAGTGYTDDEVAAIIGSMDSVDAGDPVDLEADNAADALDTAPPARVVTKPGDVWLLGGHRVMCGDCRKPGDVSRLLDGVVVNIAFTSPPYASQRAYDETSGFTPVPPDGYVDWFAPVAANVAEHLAADGSWFINIKSTAEGLDNQLYVFDLITTHARQWGWHYATEYCWERNGVPKWVKRRFKNQFEPVYQFVKNDWKMRPEAVRHASDNVPVAGGPGSGGSTWKDRQGGKASLLGGDSFHDAGTQGADGSRRDDSVAPGLAYPGNRLPTFSSSHTATGHTAAFPVGLPRFFVLAYTDAGDTVYDPFMGSGSTLLAADQEDRTAYGMEISPGYVDVTCRRFQQVTGTVPVLESTGHAHSFAESDQDG